MRIHRTAASAIAMLCMGCGVSLPRAPAVPGDEDFGPAQRVELAGVDRDEAQPMTLHPGDVVRLVTMSAENQEHEGLVVDETGVLHVPLAGDVQVGGLTLEAAEERVQTALRRFDTVVVANLFMTDPAGHRATVLGAVVTPGRYAVGPGTRLADLVAAAGGPMMEAANAESVVLADLHGARLVRNGRALPVSIAQAVRGEPRHNIRVRPGDTLYVPPTMGTRISVLGEVHTPTVVAYREGILLTEALAVAEGITIDGDRADVRVVRGDFRNPRVYTTSMVDLVNGDAHNVMLAPGDIVFVTEHWIASVGEVLDRLSPLLSSGTAFGISFALTR